MAPDSRRCFGAYEFDLATGELRRDGVPVPLQRQPARVLARLIAGAGALVPRAELHTAIWGDNVHVDFDRGLNYCIRQLREALDDDAKAPRFIETVARQGYRFVAAMAPSRPEVHRSAPARRWVGAAMLAAVLLGLVVDRTIAGSDERHHQTAVAIARAIHDIVF